MKARNTLILLSLTILVPFYLASCGEDRWANYAEQTQTDRWIDETMRVWYYWNTEIPHTNKLNYFISPAEFFKSLLSKKDGKNGTPYSTIDSLKSSTRSIAGTDYSYGFQFELFRVPDNDTAYYAHILYTAHDSPANNAQLKRGDWLMEMNEQPITKKNYEKLYGDVAINLTVGYYNAIEDSIMAYRENVRLEAARSIEDNPVHYYNVYKVDNKRIGYLVYNHFSFGPTNNSNNRPYDQSLLNAANFFAASQVNEFILDLRYNNGGYLSCAQLLCTLLAPASSLGQELGYLQYNPDFEEADTIYLDPNMITEGSNLNLKRLYVITSGETASASEMTINCLKPYMEEVFIVGQRTVGKNVGSQSFPNEELMIALNPIVCQIFNSQKKSDYANGFSPDVTINENNYIANFLPFGEPDEALLNATLNLIVSKDSEQKAPTTIHSLYAIPTANSITRRASSAIRVQ